MVTKINKKDKIIKPIVNVTRSDMEKRKIPTFFLKNSSVSLYGFLENNFEREITYPSYPASKK